MRRRHHAYRGIVAAVVGGVLTLTALTDAQATPAPLTDPAEVAAIADQLGNKRTAGIYYQDERLVVPDSGTRST
ncbi:hypothetical protein GCM10010129_78520 [Streptomyces fumigatiscleroticus]|nr:hypothetical protein GCM10010129_78520 [Streptomyces fumigatiscleroticus]